MLKMFKTKYGKKKESKCQDICQKKNGIILEKHESIEKKKLNKND